MTEETGTQVIDAPETETQEISAALDDAQAKIAPLLEELGIELVINLDDTWSLAAEDHEAVATAVITSEDFAREAVRQLEEIDSANVEGVDQSNPSSINDRLEEIWPSLEPDARTSLSQGAKAALADAAADLGEEERNDEIAAQARLQRLFSAKVEFRGLGMNDWATIRDEILAADRPVLLLVDKDFSKEEGGGETTGSTLLKQIVDAKNPAIFAALLTHTARDEDGELAVRQTLERTEQVEPGRILVIGKYRLKDHATMTAAIRDLLVLPVGEKLRALARKALEVASERARERLEEIQPYTLIGAVASAQKEGSFELDQPLRLVARAQREATLEIMRDISFAEDLEVLRSSKRVRTYLLSAQAGPQLTRVLHESVFEQGAIVNALGLPIEIGDIFRAESLFPPARGQQAPKPRHYVLLAQVCDISMRHRGAREPEVPTFVLHEFRAVAERPAQRLHSRFHGVGHFDPTSDEIWGVNFGGRIAVPSIAVDATVFNEDGSSLIVLGHAEARQMASSWMEREHEIQKRARQMITEHEESLKLLENTANAETILSRLAAATAGGTVSPKSGVTAKIDVEKKQIEYGLKRVGRLSSRVAASVAALAISYDGRPGFEMAAAIAKLDDER
ncbi:hypothetical protein E3V93_13235 [Microbacterium sp. 3H14]|uniref:hypothetical protein n=1 Tax=unclassified Microbacterium TaxID=2609290 RepID=UPI00106C71CA|nr:hypothetical protein [Microbacterium sp. 3H14]TFB17518.1 hypothetical protein E3V93_13235 [Microbacterium sp. 3H14]